jgi:type IV secretion system protein VirD4
MQERYALVLAENGKPIIARLARCIDGKAGRRLLADQKRLRAQLVEKCLEVPTAADRSAAALAEAQHHGIAADQKSYL